MESLEPLAFLRSLETFDGWSGDSDVEGSLADLADRTEVWAFSEGDLVRFPDESPGGPTWVAEGCLTVTEDGEPPRYVGVREVLGAPAGVWVKGQTSGQLVTVPEAAWRDWLQAWPAAAWRLGEPVPPRVPRALLRSPLVLEPGETPVHRFRKSGLFLMLRATVPALFFLLFLSFGLALQFGLGANVPPAALWFLPALGMLVTVSLVALVWWEWSSSILVVTDRSVILRQLDVWTHRSDFEKLALERVREAVFSRRGLLQSLLGLVTLELEGDSPNGRLLFRGLPNTCRFLEAMEGLRARRVLVTPGRGVIRQALADRAGGAKAPRLERPATRNIVLGPRVHWWSWRVETDSGVWFRRHPWLAVRRSLPWIGWLALVAFLAVVAGLLVPQGIGLVAATGALAALFPVGRIVWEIWDWADDRLSIQGERIILVHRRPLWLGEIRQEGSLDQVQQVGVRKESLAALVLDFGVVTVSLGASEPLVFENASHPEWVQNEIFHRRSLLVQDRERQFVRTRLNEVSEILDTWEEARRAGYFTKESP